MNRADSDTGLEADLALDGAAKAVRLRVDIARMSEEEAALLDRLDPDLLKAPPPTRALDMKLVGCERPMPPIGVLFRNGTVAIKGGSLNRIDSLVALFRDCEDGMLVIEDNPQGSVDIDGDERLATRRHEELKYYLLQRLVPMESMRFPGDS